MLISPIFTRFSPVNYTNRTNQKPSFGINATETAKLSEDIDRYQSTMTIFPEYAKFFIENVDKIRTKGPKTILDAGSNQGELTRIIRKNFPKMKTINLDLVPTLSRISKKKDKEEKLTQNVFYKSGNAMDLPVSNNSLDAIMFSRIIHEIYSYDCEKLGAEKFSMDSVERTFLNAHNKLRKNGRVLIKDPAKPDDYNKLVVIKNFKNKDDVKFKTKDLLLNADVTKLKTRNLLKRFCYEFEPANGHFVFNKDECIMPKWLASEFIRHRKFSDTELHWKDEINEQYGIMTNKEYKKLAEKSGFKVVLAEHNFKPDSNNFYAINDEFQIFDTDGNKLVQEKEFPVDQYLILEKK